MAGVLADLKAHARILHRQVVSGEPGAVTRLRRLPELSNIDAATLQQRIRRRHCLAVIARELGFQGWSHAVAVLRGRHPTDFNSVIKFVIGHGRVISRASISMKAIDPQLISAARDTLARLRDGQPAVSLSWSDGTEGIVTLGLPALQLPVEMLERLSEPTRDVLESGREVRERKQRDGFFQVKTGGVTDCYCLAGQASAGLLTLAGLYGAVLGSFGRDEKRKSADERDLRPLAERIQQFKEVAAQIVGAAPAFLCSGRLSGVAAAFADCFAIAMLSDPDASIARTTAA